MVLPSAPQSATLLWLQQLLPGFYYRRTTASFSTGAECGSRHESEWIRLNQNESNESEYSALWLQAPANKRCCRRFFFFIHAACMTNMQELCGFFCHPCNIYIHTTWCPAPVFIAHVRACTLPECHLARQLQRGSTVGCNDRVVQPLGGVAGDCVTVVLS